MKKALKVIALILAISCLFSATVFAVDLSVVDWNDVLSEEALARCYNESNYENEFEVGVITVSFKKGIPLDADFVELLPEIEIDEIRNVLKIGERPWVVIELAEKTRESVLEAIDLLKENDVVRYSEPNYVVYLEIPLIQGDVDGNGELTNSDLIIIARYIVGMAELNVAQLTSADMNTDGDITNGDLIALARVLVSIA